MFWCEYTIFREGMYWSHTTLFVGRGISSIYYIRYNYMLRRLTMVIFRLYMKYLVGSYTRLNMGCIQWGGIQPILSLV